MRPAGTAVLLSLCLMLLLLPAPNANAYRRYFDGFDSNGDGDLEYHGYDSYVIALERDGDRESSHAVVGAPW